MTKKTKILIAAIAAFLAAAVIIGIVIIANRNNNPADESEPDPVSGTDSNPNSATESKPEQESSPEESSPEESIPEQESDPVLYDDGPADPESIFQTVCSADDALALARRSNVPVFEQRGCTSGKEVWDGFYQAVSRGESAQVLCASYYTLDPAHVSPELYEQEKDQYPRLFFSLLSYDGETYTVKVRQSDRKELDHEDQFPYLLHLTGKMPGGTAFATYDNYVLVDDPTATMEGIWAGILSSQAFAGYRHYIAYQDTAG